MVTAMSPAKLTDTDKQELVDLYRQTPATTTTLAERFGVSVSTVSRLLKMAIASGEYETLVQEKRGNKSPKIDAQLTLPLPDSEKAPVVLQVNKPVNKPLSIVPEVASESESNSQDSSTTVNQGRRVRSRKRSSADSVSREINQPEKTSGKTGHGKPTVEVVSVVNKVKKIDPPAIVAPPAEQSIATEWENSITEAQVQSDSPITQRPQIISIKSSALDEIVKDIDEDLDLLDDEAIDALDDDDEDDDQDDDFEDGLDDFDDDQEDEFSTPPVTAKKAPRNTEAVVSILPLVGATMPKNCYLVVDRRGELIVRPLKEFSFDGVLPPGEVQAKTLPVFDNHRVARRFSLRTQKVIRLPDAGMVQKTAQALKSKGITRVFMGGQVYSL
ncbi:MULTISPECIES: hypothetical protein [unclassified Synechocystis]|uniref:hypothetical protein n=1 Tax=unclassified Synechocystis TaxID=2640012 RepID=UPI000429FB99|nr:MULTISPECIES: hypothetical protein [unclassified Synechocystis]AIE75247.1 hypothetical protein D082_27190 [Synechocystis sp. PCC 6714]MCT0252990.1 helix-turn-helix domain-containing protein [Synechocystis sp. CS-94]